MAHASSRVKCLSPCYLVVNFEWSLVISDRMYLLNPRSPAFLTARFSIGSGSVIAALIILVFFIGLTKITKRRHAQAIK